MTMPTANYNRRPGTLTGISLIALVLVAATPIAFAQGSGYTLVGWNDLGMHCMDADYSVFSILPPYNTIHAQVINPRRPRDQPSGFTVTYEAVADPGRLDQYLARQDQFLGPRDALFGASPAPDEGLAGCGMPGTVNTPQPMDFDSAFDWFTGEGIPITPYDDAGRKNYYPMMRLVARNCAATFWPPRNCAAGVRRDDLQPCHGSGSGPAARPSGGWVNDPDPERDYRLNILRLHDDLEGEPRYSSALAAAGYNSAGLYATVAADGTPMLCAPATPPTRFRAPASPASRHSPRRCTPSRRGCRPATACPSTRRRTAPRATPATPVPIPAVCAAQWARLWPPLVTWPFSARAATAA